MAKSNKQDHTTESKQPNIEGLFDSVWKILGYFCATLVAGFYAGRFLSDDICRELTKDLINEHRHEMRDLREAFQEERLQVTNKRLDDLIKVNEEFLKKRTQ